MRQSFRLLAESQMQQRIGLAIEAARIVRYGGRWRNFRR
jgi:hypothetical protein